jgi:hypothetical protein
VRAAVATVLLLLVAPGAPHAETTLHAPIDAARLDGRIDEAEARLLRLELVLDPTSVPAEYSPDEPAPIPCATSLFIELRAILDQLDEAQLERAAKLLAPGVRNKRTQSHLSPSGNFVLHYELSGNNRIPAEDLAPANGVPDFVESMAAYLDASWSIEVDAMGYLPPSLVEGPYEVFFQNMFSFGFTQLAGTRTEIHFHNDFDGFGTNDDPEGAKPGFMKVTCAHEFKHASQFTTSSWSEGTWLELDAAWIEDFVYDQVNDYYRWLNYNSPLSDPGVALDSGGSASYSACIWQHYLSGLYSIDFMREFWERRESFFLESMLDSYEATLAMHGTDIEAVWPLFGVWNYLTGGRAVLGMSYEEAAGYPTAALTETATSYPFVRAGGVPRLANHFVRCSGFPLSAGTVDFQFTREAGSGLVLSAVVEKRNGSVLVETFPPADVLDLSLATPLDEIAAVGFVVSNGRHVPVRMQYTLAIDPAIEIVTPVLASQPTQISVTILAGGSGQTSFELSNGGSPSSVIDYQVHALLTLPPAKRSNHKSIAGSTVSADSTSYAPGDTIVLSLSLANNSPDEEWISEATLDLPAGVTAVGSSDFVGGSNGSLVSDGSTGDGVVLHWFDPNGGTGQIRDGELASATVSLAFDPFLWGDLSFDWTLDGDQWAADPHSVQGSFTLVGPNDVQLNWGEPVDGSYFALGSVVAVSWSTQGSPAPALVDLELSRDGGAGWEMLSSDEINDGSYAWLVDGTETADALLRVRSSDGSLSAPGAAAGVIYAPVPWINLQTVSGQLSAGESHTIILELLGAGLALGSHTAWIVVVDPARGLELILPTQLDVLSGGTPAPSQQRLDLLANVPNPFNPSTQLRFVLAAAGHARLRIFDARGALVTVLLDLEMPSGAHTMEWKGKDSRGRSVASGVYRAVLESAGEQVARSIALVR